MLAILNDNILILMVNYVAGFCRSRGGALGNARGRGRRGGRGGGGGFLGRGGRGGGGRGGGGRGRGKKKPVERSAVELDKELDNYHAEAMHIA